MAAAHLFIAGLLWHLVPTRPPLVSPPVLRVALLASPAPEVVPAPAPSLPHAQPAWTAPPLAVPTLAPQARHIEQAPPAPAAPPPPAPAASPPPAPVAPAPPEPVVPAAAAVPQSAPPPPPPPPPREPSASQIAYLVPPPVELPLASRRLGEQGTVWLRVRVGADGVPRQVQLLRSSGHARLDEQALSAMRRARFRPQVDNGVPVEWTVIAPLQYEIS